MVRISGVIALSTVAFMRAAHALECGDAPVSFDGLATAATTWRIEAPDPALVSGPNARAATGGTGSAPGQNSDDGNLNARRGDRVYEVYKALGVMGVDCGTLAARLSAYAWTDRIAEHRSFDWGHSANDYVAGAQLSDAGAPTRAQFTGVALQEAWVQWQAAPGSWLRVGRQNIPWGSPKSTLGGGAEQVNAIDMQLMAMPGRNANIDPESEERGDIDPLFEGLVPAPAVLARHTISRSLDEKRTVDTVIDGFYQFGFEPNVIPGCGRFASHADYLAPGCDRVFVAPALSDRAALAGNLYGERARDIEAADGGQFGVRIQHTDPRYGRFTLHAANIHSRRYVTSALTSTRTVPPVPLLPGDFDENVRYLLEYPEDVKLYGIGWAVATRDKLSALSVDYTMQPNQVLRLNGSDMISAFASNAAPTPLRADALLTPRGSIYTGGDRLRVSQLRLSGRHTQQQVLGAAALNITGETAVKFVHDLPDPLERRYGRSDSFGVGPVAGSPCVGDRITCSNRGYVSPSAWGYRIRAELEYANVHPALRVRPSVTLLHDVSGWSWDDAISEGRKAAAFAVRVEHVRQGWFGEISVTSIWGGDYNIARDRDFAQVAVGVRLH